MTPETLQQFSAILLRARKAGMSTGLVHPCLVLHAAGEDYVLARDLAVAMGVSPAAITGTVDRIEVKGWLMRVAHFEDRRVKSLRVTPSGAEVFKKVFNELPEE